MRENRIVKAYTAAWRWPEVYTTSPSLIWTSRAIAVLVPLSLVGLVVLTGVPLFGLAATGVSASLLVLIIILMTVHIFYQEYDTVEDFQSRELRIKEFFHGFPSITDVPLIEHDPGEWIAYGHIPPEEFTTAIRQVLDSVMNHPPKSLQLASLTESVGHLYATFKNPEEGHWGEGINFCKGTAENCFPITRLEL
jgi:hypothetical protein